MKWSSDRQRRRRTPGTARRERRTRASPGDQQACRIGRRGRLTHLANQETVPRAGHGAAIAQLSAAPGPPAPRPRRPGPARRASAGTRWRCRGRAPPWPAPRSSIRASVGESGPAGRGSARSRRPSATPGGPERPPRGRSGRRRRPRSFRRPGGGCASRSPIASGSSRRAPAGTTGVRWPRARTPSTRAASCREGPAADEGEPGGGATDVAGDVQHLPHADDGKTGAARARVLPDVQAEMSLRAPPMLQGGRHRIVRGNSSNSSMSRHGRPERRCSKVVVSRAFSGPPGEGLEASRRHRCPLRVRALAEEILITSAPRRPRVDPGRAGEDPLKREPEDPRASWE